MSKISKKTNYNRFKKNSLKRKKIQKGSGNKQYNCGDITVYKGFCHDLPSQCCDTTNSNVCSRTGGGLKKSKIKNQKGGSQLRPEIELKNNIRKMFRNLFEVLEQNNAITEDDGVYLNMKSMELLR